MSKPEPDEKVVITDLLMLVGGWFLHGWYVMLLFGVLHSSATAVPAFGYWPCVFIVWTIYILVSSGTHGIFQRIKTLTPLYGKKVQATDSLRQLVEQAAQRVKASTN